MKRPFVESFPDADDIFDPSESSGKVTSYPGKVSSPFHAPSDSDYLSDDSKKTRKKRSAYQKIADDVRMKLLECVKNGETLKSAAKRFKINYSSAKSILHTFRKEGRILKKSAQERTTKKKINAENEHPHKPQKHLKKETPRKVQRFEDSVVVGKSANESNPLNSRKNSNCAARAADFFESHHDQKTAPIRKGSAFFNKTHQEETKPREDFYNHHHVYETTTHQEAPMHSNFMFFSQNETFPDMSSSAFYNRNMTNDEFAFDPNSFLFSKTADMQFLLDDKMQKMDGGVYEQNEGYDVKNYMDHQNVYRTALRKASFFSSTSNGMRKSSFDMY